MEAQALPRFLRRPAALVITMVGLSITFVVFTTVVLFQFVKIQADQAKK